MKKVLLMLVLLSTIQAEAYLNRENSENSATNSSWFTTPPTINFFSSSTTTTPQYSGYNPSQSSQSSNPLGFATGKDLGFVNEDVHAAQIY